MWGIYSAVYILTARYFVLNYGMLFKIKVFTSWHFEQRQSPNVILREEFSSEYQLTKLLTGKLFVNHCICCLSEIISSWYYDDVIHALYTLTCLIGKGTTDYPLLFSWRPPIHVAIWNPRFVSFRIQVIFILPFFLCPKLGF